MLYDFIEFKSTMIKSYYRISVENIENNKNTNIVSNDEQMHSNENKFSNDKKAIEQFLKFQNTKTNAVTLSAIIPSAIILGAITLSANALNAAALGASDLAESEKTPQSSSIKRGRGRSRKQSNAQLNQPNLTIFLLNEIGSSTSSSRIFYAKSTKKNQRFTK